MSWKVYMYHLARRCIKHAEDKAVKEYIFLQLTSCFALWHMLLVI